MSETTKPAAKKAAAPKSKTDNDTNEQTGNSGPQTGQSAPPESSYRPPATVVNSDSSPLDPPADTHTQTDPEQGYSASSTDHVYAEAGGRTVAGEDHQGLVDADGNSLSADGLFDDSDSSKTYVTTKTRIYEEFYYPNTTEPARRLMFAEGRRVPRAQAERIKAALSNAPEPAATANQRTGNGERQQENGDK